VQLAFEDFNQPIGLKMNPSNRWIQKAELIPWAELEKDYAKNFRNKKGNVAKPFRMAFGALLIQKEYSYSDEETVLQIQENPYLQFFIGLPGYQDAKPFDASTMVYFWKQLAVFKMTFIDELFVQ
ncbi:transposase, partial [Lactococcus lactis]